MEITFFIYSPVRCAVQEREWRVPHVPGDAGNAIHTIPATTSDQVAVAFRDGRKSAAIVHQRYCRADIPSADAGRRENQGTSRQVRTAHRVSVPNHPGHTS